MEEDLLYHYTSLDTFYKIIGSQEKDEIVFRATHARFMNDPFEYDLAFTFIEKAYREYEKINKIVTPFKNIKELFHSRDIFGEPFILSFSGQSDNLSMWRSYASNGKGIAIGLDKKMIHDYEKDAKNQNTKLLKCLYDEQLIINNLVNYLKDHYHDFIEKDKQFISNGNGFFHTFYNFAMNSFQFKNKHYNIENEWRLCKNEAFDDNIHFIESNGIMKPFINHRFPKSIIKRITIGPCADQEKVKESICIFLKVNGFDLQRDTIIISDVPYREI